ncbi:MAG TPA: GNAT family protein [Bacteroidia bacterium]
MVQHNRNSDKKVKKKRNFLMDNYGMNLCNRINNQSFPLSMKGIEILPMEEQDISNLLSLSRDPEIWQHYSVDAGNDRVFIDYMMGSLLQKENGKRFPFVVRLKQSGRVIGSTQFLDIQEEHLKLEIGFTWYTKNDRSKGINEVCKYLLLKLCFEVLGLRRVQFKTNENNLTSRHALLKIGTSFEGILRNDIVGFTGSKRNSAYYSIIEEEWPKVKQHLEQLIESKSQTWT